jgi:hypothetical protein
MRRTASSRMSRSRRALAGVLALDLSTDGGSPATGCRSGAPLDRLSGGGPGTIVWRLVSQWNQRIDRPPFDLVTPPPLQPGRLVPAVWKQCATGPPRPSLIHGGARGCPPGLEWATRDTGFADPRRAGVRGENHTFLPCQGSWQGSRCPDRNLNRYAGIPPVHQAASVAQVRQRKGDKPSGSTDHRSGRGSTEAVRDPASPVATRHQCDSCEFPERASVYRRW